MTEEQNPLAGATFETKGVPTVYSNHASPSVSFNDVRIYFGEVLPKQLNVASSPDPTAAEVLVEARICVIISPEFARNLAQVLSTAVEKYESIFGPLRTQPDAQEVMKKLSPKQ